MSQKKPNTFAKWLGITVGITIGYFQSAFFLMLAAALAHKDIHQIPAPGYWASFGLVWTTAIIGGAWGTSRVASKAWESK